MSQNMQGVGFANSSYAADTPVPAGSDPFAVATATASETASLRQTQRVAFTAPSDQPSLSEEADFFGDATSAPENAAAPFQSFYSPVAASDDVSNEDVTSDDKDRRHAALDKARVGYQMRTREMLRNMQENLDVAASGADL